MIRVDGRGNSSSLIKVRGLNKTYSRGGEKIQVLQGLNLDVDKGDFVAFIPKSAVRSEAGSSFVFLFHDGKVERRAVKLGTERGTDVAVLAGVLPGDSLVVKGPESLHDGDKVEIRTGSGT